MGSKRKQGEGKKERCGNLCSFEYSTQEAVVKVVPTNKLIDVRFFEDRENGKSKGVAQLDFWDAESAKAAVKALKGAKFHGKQCKAELAPEVGRKIAIVVIIIILMMMCFMEKKKKNLLTTAKRETRKQMRTSRNAYCTN